MLASDQSKTYKTHLRFACFDRLYLGVPEVFEERAAVTLSGPHNQCRTELQNGF